MLLLGPYSFCLLSHPSLHEIFPEVKVKSFSRVRLFATPWTVAYQASPSVGFSRHTGVGCHFLLQRIFPIQGLNPGLLHCSQILNPPNHQGSPQNVFWMSPTFLKTSIVFSILLFSSIYLNHLFKKVFLISLCYSQKLCIQLGVSFPFSLAFHFSCFLSYL